MAAAQEDSYLALALKEILMKRFVKFQATLFGLLLDSELNPFLDAAGLPITLFQAGRKP
jgi:hypothetical protein